MNTAIVLLVVCATAVEVLAGPQGILGPHGEKKKQFMDECMETSGADAEAIKVSKRGIAVNEEVKCFYACMGKKTGMLNEDGTVNKQKITYVPPLVRPEHKDTFHDVRAICAEILGENACDTAWLIWKCLDPLSVPPYPIQRRK